MDKLTEARAVINEADSIIREQFEKRMQAVKEIAAWKKEKGLPVLDAAREKEVIERNSEKLEDPSLAPYYISFLESMMTVSRKYQEDILSEDQTGKSSL